MTGADPGPVSGGPREATAVDRLVELLLRFNRPGPRYTSYPPANHFHAGFGPAEYERALADAGARGASEPLSLYLHLPFCGRRCAYCGCHSFLGTGPAAVDAYLDDVEVEVEAVAARLPSRRTVWQLQWGGGTPNYLGPAQMERAFGILARRFSLAPGAEVGVEIDPRFVTREHFVVLRRLGFNRVSLGVQDTDARVQRLIGRGQTEEQTRAAAAACREVGFGSVHFDLVYGLPGQTRDSFARTIASVVAMSPDRLALFGFAYLPSLRPNQQALDPAAVPGPRDRAYLYAEAVERLTAAGYVRIGMDHFARPDDELARAQAAGRLYRNFQGYTTRAGESDLVAFGVSAIGDVAGRYAQNEKDLAAYHELVGRSDGRSPGPPRLATVRGFHLSDDDLVRRDVIMTLMCNLGVDYREIERRHRGRLRGPFREAFAAELRSLGDLVEAGFVAVDGAAMRMRPEAWPLVRLGAMAFDAHLDRAETGSGGAEGPAGEGALGGARYSQIV